MKDLRLRAREVVRTSNMKISRRRWADYVKTLYQKACRTSSTIIFLHSTNQINDLWRCRWQCRHQILNSLTCTEVICGCHWVGPRCYLPWSLTDCDSPFQDSTSQRISFHQDREKVKCYVSLGLTLALLEISRGKHNFPWNVDTFTATLQNNTAGLVMVCDGFSFLPRYSGTLEKFLNFLKLESNLGPAYDY